jgi:hypothetical protein
LSEVCIHLSDSRGFQPEATSPQIVLQGGLCDNWFSGRRDQPVANSVSNTQPDPRRNSKFVHGNELPVPFRAAPSHR